MIGITRTIGFRAAASVMLIAGMGSAQAACPTPLADLACRQTELRITAADGHVMAGEVLLPRKGKRVPVMMLVSGTGRQSRDFEAFDGRYHPHRDIARALLAAGIGVIRFDERNTGASTGDHKTARSADLRMDVRLIFDRAAQVPGVDTRRMFLFGHSEGAIFAMQLAARDPLVAGIALAGAPWKSGREMTWDQIRIETPRPAGMRDADFEVWLRGKYDEEISFQQSRPSLADLLDYDGRATAAGVRRPALILEALEDWQVRPPQGRQLAEAIHENGNRLVRYRALEGVGHLLTPNPAGVTDYAKLPGYSVDRRVLDALVDWVRFASRKAGRP